MPSSAFSSRMRCRSARSVARLFAGLALCLFDTAAASDRDAAAWQVEPRLDLRMVTYYQHVAGASTSYPALGAQLGLELSSPHSPLAAGLFADYEFAAGSGPGDLRRSGGWARCRVGRWELSAAGVHLAVGRPAGRWLYLHKLRLEPRPGHRVAVLGIGAMDGGPTAVELAYEADLSRRLTLAIAVGIGPHRLADVGASTKFVWNLR